MEQRTNSPYPRIDRPVLAAIGDDHAHSTAARVAAAAGRHGVRSLVLTHFSPRYGDAGSGPTIDDVEREARAGFDGTLHLARDFDRVAIARDGSSISVS